MTIAGKLRSIVGQRLVKPWQQVFHFSIDPKLPWLSTSIAPTGGAMQIKLPTSLTHHRSTTIPLTGVNPTLLQACADHGVMDLSWVSFITASAIDYGDLSLLKNVWSHSTGSKSAPARDPAFGTVSWFGDGMGKTNQIYVPNKRDRKHCRVAAGGGTSCLSWEENWAFTTILLQTTRESYLILS